MSGTAAVAVVLVLLSLCGLGVLALLDVARSTRELLLRAPVAPLAGAAWVGVAAATFAAAEVGFGLAGLVVVTAVTTVAGAGRLARSASRRDAPSDLTPSDTVSQGVERALAGVALAVLGIVGAFAFATYHVKPLVEYDGWAIWGMKAKAIAWLDADTAVLASDAYARLHIEYPLLLPALNALPIDAAERFDSSIVVLNCVVLGAAGLLALWGVFHDRVRPALLLPFLAAIAAMPAFFFQLGSGYADVPLAMFVAAGAAAAARWLLDGRGSWLALATVFLAASALAKNEGLLFAVAVLVSLLAVASGRRRAVLLAAGAVGLAYAPWRAYITAHDLGSPAYDLSSTFDLSLAGERLRRVPEAVLGVLEQAVRPGEVGLLVLVGATCVALALVVGARRLALFAFGFAVLSLGGLAWIYAISPMDVSSFVDSSAHRVVLSVVVGVAALAALLAEESARALARRGEPSGDAGSLSTVGRTTVLGRHPSAQ